MIRGGWYMLALVAEFSAGKMEYVFYNIIR
jgi:hypothetical protein